MRVSRIIIIAMALVVTAAGCKKDNNRISIYAENMGGGKVLVDPSNLNSSWVADETIDFNHSTVTIAGNDNTGYYLNGVEPLNATMYAIYPGSEFDGNDLSVENNNGSGEVVINRLVVRFDGTGKHKVVFPMSARAGSGENRLLFNHLTAGFNLTLHNTQADGVNVASVKVVLRSTTTADNLGIDIDGNDGLDYTARWNVQGPTVPNGTIGGLSGDIDVKYSCEMNFDLRSGNNAYATVPGSGTNGGNLKFCVPVTVSKARYLTVIGYSTSGTEIFRAHKDLESDIDVDCNSMYTIPTISID